jgi:Putative MetA-pathway of phenol degradation
MRLLQHFFDRNTAVAAATLAALLHGGPAGAGCSSCPCGDATFLINDARLLALHRVLMSVDYLNTSNESAPHVHPGQAATTVETVARVENDVRFTAQYGLAPRVTFMASLPYVFKQQTLEGVTGSVQGVGDLDLTAVALLAEAWAARLAFHATADVRAPTGDSQLPDELGGIDPHLQPGTGAWSAIGGLQATLDGAVPLFVGASYQWNDTNAQEFHFGDVFRFNFGAQRTVTGPVDAIGEINGRWADTDTHEGVSDPNSGGTVVYFSPGLRWRIAPVVHLRGQVQFPVLEDLYGVQDEKAAARVALVWLP